MSEIENHPGFEQIGKVNFLETSPSGLGAAALTRLNSNTTYFSGVREKLNYLLSYYDNTHRNSLLWQAERSKEEEKKHNVIRIRSQINKL